MGYYGTTIKFENYHIARGRDPSVFEYEDVEAALLIASEWLDGSFRDRFPGLKVGMREQVREWPRTAVLDRNGYAVSPLYVPNEIESATYEAAYRHLQTPGSLQVDYTPNKYSEVAVEGAVRVKYNNLDASTIQKNFPIIGYILDGLLGGSGNFSPLSSGTVRV